MDVDAKIKTVFQIVLLLKRTLLSMNYHLVGKKLASVGQKGQKHGTFMFMHPTEKDLEAILKSRNILMRILKFNVI